MSQDDVTRYPTFPALEYAAFPPLAVVESALAAREAARVVASGDPASESAFFRAAASLFRAVVALVGAHTERRRQTGAYQVVTHTERAAVILHPAARPPVSPRLMTLEVIAPRMPGDPRYTALLELALPARNLGLGATLTGPLVAAHRYNPAWPEQLRCAYRACAAAHGAWVAACDAEWEGRTDAARQANNAAYQGWASLERWYLPLFRAWETENGVDPNDPATAPLEAVDGRRV